MARATYRERLTADELRNIEEGTYLVVELHDGEYWSGAEGEVNSLTEYDTGAVTVHIKGTRGHPAKVKIPSDARKGLRYYGPGVNTHGLRVNGVYER